MHAQDAGQLCASHTDIGSHSLLAQLHHLLPCCHDHCLLRMAARLRGS
jgi:hypothetical protein